MAITIHTLADLYSPASHPIHWIVKSDQISNEGFEYIADIYSGDELLISQPIPKSPSGGYGVIDIAPFMRSHISHQAGLTFGSTGFSENNLYEKAYTIQWGEVYASWEYDDFFYASEHEGRVLFSSETIPHDFVVGDMINVDQTTPFTNSTYQGTQTVFAVPDAYSIVIDLGFGSSAGEEGGVIRRINGTPIIHTGLTATTVSYALGYSLPHELFGTDPAMPSLYEYFVHGEGDTPMGGKAWLTDQPTTFRMREDAQAFVPIRNPQAMNYLRRISVQTYDSNGDAIGEYSINNSFIPQWSKRWMYAAIGPYNLANATYGVVSGPSQMLSSDVARMDVMIKDFGLDPTMAEYTKILIDRRCAKEEVFNLLFIDKKGSWSTFSFTAKHDRRDRIGPRLYGKGDYGRIHTAAGRGSMIYEPADLGSGTFHLTHNKEFTLRTEWLTDQENEYFQQLIASPMIFWMRTPTQGIPMVIEEGEYDLEKVGPNTIVRRSVNLQKAYSENMVIPASYILRSTSMSTNSGTIGGGEQGG